VCFLAAGSADVGTPCWTPLACKRDFKASCVTVRPALACNSYFGAIQLASRRGCHHCSVTCEQPLARYGAVLHVLLAAVGGGDHGQVTGIYMSVIC
jgi:hypothetical protein